MKAEITKLFPEIEQIKDKNLRDRGASTEKDVVQKVQLANWGTDRYRQSRAQFQKRV